jgi:putative sigma-54 modulation protein
MNVSITFRNMEPSEAIKRHVREKLAELQKSLRQPMTAKVTLSIDGLEHIAETRITSGRAHLDAKEAGEDMYASIDRVMAKLKRQIRGAKGAPSARRSSGERAVAVGAGRAKKTRVKARSKKAEG